MAQAPESGAPVPQAPPLFTVAEATRLLPYLRSTLAAAQTHRAEVRAIHTEMRRMEAIGRNPAGLLIMAADHSASAERMQQHQSECERLLRHVAERGCQVKDLTVGLCDFPGIIAGQPALLCWRLDEPSIDYYHSVRDGYAGRRPIPPGTP